MSTQKDYFDNVLNIRTSVKLRRENRGFEMLRYVSKQIAIGQNLYTRGEGKSLYFLKALCLLFPKSLKWGRQVNLVKF